MAQSGDGTVAPAIPGVELAEDVRHPDDAHVGGARPAPRELPDETNRLVGGIDVLRLGVGAGKDDARNAALTGCHCRVGGDEDVVVQDGRVVRQ